MRQFAEWQRTLLLFHCFLRIALHCIAFYLLSYSIVLQLVAGLAAVLDRNWMKPPPPPPDPLAANARIMWCALLKGTRTGCFFLSSKLPCCFAIRLCPNVYNAMLRCFLCCFAMCIIPYRMFLSGRRFTMIGEESHPGTTKYPLSLLRVCPMSQVRDRAGVAMLAASTMLRLMPPAPNTPSSSSSSSAAAASMPACYAGAFITDA